MPWKPPTQKRIKMQLRTVHAIGPAFKLDAEALGAGFSHPSVGRPKGQQFTPEHRRRLSEAGKKRYARSRD